MKAIKTMALTVGLLFAFTVSAQEHKKEQHRGYNPSQIAEKMTQRMTKTLKLTPEQVEQVHEANMKLAQKRKENFEEMKAYMAEHKVTLQQTLTEEQWAKHEKQRAKVKGKLKQRRQNMHAPPQQK